MVSVTCVVFAMINEVKSTRISLENTDGLMKTRIRVKTSIYFISRINFKKDNLANAATIFSITKIVSKLKYVDAREDKTVNKIIKTIFTLQSILCITVHFPDSKLFKPTM